MGKVTFRKKQAKKDIRFKLVYCNHSAQVTRLPTKLFQAFFLSQQRRTKVFSIKSKEKVCEKLFELETSYLREIKQNYRLNCPRGIILIANIVLIKINSLLDFLWIDCILRNGNCLWLKLTHKTILCYWHKISVNIIFLNCQCISIVKIFTINHQNKVIFNNITEKDLHILYFQNWSVILLSLNLA